MQNLYIDPHFTHTHTHTYLRRVVSGDGKHEHRAAGILGCYKRMCLNLEENDIHIPRKYYCYTLMAHTVCTIGL